MKLRKLATYRSFRTNVAYEFVKARYSIPSTSAILSVKHMENVEERMEFLNVLENRSNRYEFFDVLRKKYKITTKEITRANKTHTTHIYSDPVTGTKNIITSIGCVNL